MKFLKSVANKLGVDKAIAYSSGARIVQAFTGVGSIFFISTFLTGVEQGYYYTFGSILALQVFFELGLMGIMTQYVAHEASHLTLDENREYQGEIKYKSRLSSLVCFCVKWYSILAIIVALFLLIFGFFYFSKYGESQGEVVSWEIPWVIISLATAIQLFLSPFTSILNGLGFIKEISKITFWQQLIVPTVSWLGLALGLKLYVSGVGYLISVIIWFIFTKKQNLLKVILNLFKVKISESVHYMREIFPYQWRIALSWISGYFIFQLFNPVLFATEGAVVAGQMGMTLTALNAIQAFSMSWLNTKVPVYSSLIAQKEFSNLDYLFNKTLKQMTFVCGSLLLTFLAFICILRGFRVALNGSLIADRFLTFVPMCLMLIPVFLQQFTNSWATYLRCHKKEPFLAISIINGLLCLLSTFFLGKIYGLYGVVIGYCAIQIVLFPCGYYIYSSNKKKWHTL